MQKYTSFQAHENEVRYLLTNDEGVLSLTHNEIRFTKRHGIKLFSLRYCADCLLEQHIQSFNDLFAFEDEH